MDNYDRMFFETCARLNLLENLVSDVYAAYLAGYDDVAGKFESVRSGTDDNLRNAKMPDYMPSDGADVAMALAVQMRQHAAAFFDDVKRKLVLKGAIRS